VVPGKPELADYLDDVFYGKSVGYVVVAPGARSALDAAGRRGAPGLWGIAVYARQVAAPEAQEDLPDPYERTLALNGIEYLLDVAACFRQCVSFLDHRADFAGVRLDVLHLLDEAPGHLNGELVDVLDADLLEPGRANRRALCGDVQSQVDEP
jgi:hypothetical protein